MGSCCYEHFDTPVFSESYRKAAKDYKCCECRVAIQRGDTYQRTSILQDGMWFDYKTCEDCADLRESLSDVDCLYYGGLSECYTNFLIEVGAVLKVKEGSHAARLVPSYLIEDQAIKVTVKGVEG